MMLFSVLSVVSAVLCLVDVAVCTQCSPDEMVNCFVDPCTVTSCPAYPSATCRSNYCGGCNAEFYTTDGVDVTTRCNGVCPPPGGFGLCVEHCRGDSACPSGQLCCSTGCGHMCMNGVVPQTTTSNTSPQGTTVGTTPPSTPCSLPCPVLQCLPGLSPKTLPGDCCPSCQPTPTAAPTATPSTPDCKLIQCDVPVCPDNVPPVTLPGDCCPSCLPVATTAPPRPTACPPCPLPLCLPGYDLVTLPGDCCPSCQATTATPSTPDCGLILCALPVCPNNVDPVILPGDCCPSCPSTTTAPPTAPPTASCPPCPLPRCLPEYRLVTLPGECCPTCQLLTTSATSMLPTGATAITRPAICALVRCAYPTCSDGATPITPLDRCCPICPPVECFSPIYPEGSVPLCLVAVRRWTFLLDRSGCSEFSYRPCGQREEEYNVFPDQESCERRCGHLTISSTTPPTTPTIQPPDCSAVSCLFPECAGGVTPTVLPNECCPRCPETGGCVYEGRVVAVGDSFPASDGCNSCFCGPDGGVGCTEIACITTVPPAVVRPVPLHAMICPYMEPSDDASCIVTCSSDGDCDEGLKCCSSGCQRTCVRPDLVPYYNIPLECPINATLDPVARCDVSRPQCTDNSACSANQLCCQNGQCGRYCTAGVPSSQPCAAIRNLFNVSGVIHLPGAYIPSCQDDGTFMATQFHGSTGLSWCVNVQTGYPVSSFYPRGVTAQCASCMDGAGNRYQVGQAFPSPDCNTCTCVRDDVVACTRRACPDTCSLPPDTGSCRAAIPTFYFDQSSRSCRLFSYGGCGGNGNKFQNLQDCLSMCNPTSRCLQSKEVGVCDALFPSYFFNVTSGACQRFIYGGCGGNDNRFSTEAECTTACLPDAPPDPCSGVRCAAPNCPRGTVLTTDDTRCCPYCVNQTVACRPDQMQCFSGECIPLTHVCDALADCPNGEDEDNCEESCDFMCGDGSCIESSHVCDSQLDCTDHSDAENCSVGLTGVEYLQPSDLPRQCPDANDVPTSCGRMCSQDAQCGDGQACCDNGCSLGMSCTAAIPIKPACRIMQQRARLSGLFGLFIPSCEEDGRFSEQQCHERYCWCVDVMTGQPVTNGVVASSSSSPCARCSRDNGDSIPVGASFSSDDGCNTCKCTKEYGIICTNQHCPTKSCQLGITTIAHEQEYTDSCTTCVCVSGRLRCRRRLCSVKEEPVTVTMTFQGDYDRLIGEKNQLIRQVKRTLVTEYGQELNLQEGQLQGIKLFRGSIGVTITLEPRNNTGANVTVVLSQLEQDYMSGILVIRYDGMVLQPTGNFETQELVSGPSEPSSGASFQWWHGLFIGIGAALLVSSVAILVIAAVLVTKRKRSPLGEPLDNDYEVSFKKDDAAIGFD